MSSRHMLYGTGNAKEQIFCEQVWNSCDDPSRLTCCFTGSNFKLEQWEYSIKVDSVQEAIDVARNKNVDSVILLNIEQFESGLSEIFSREGLGVFGVGKSASELECSKHYAKQFMSKYGVISPASQTFTIAGQAVQYLKKNWGEREFVVKASAYVNEIRYSCQVPQSLEEAISSVYELSSYLDAVGLDPSIIIEEKLYGSECSLHLILDSQSYHVLPKVVDYKSVFEYGLGPNTAGIGSVSTTEEWDRDELRAIKDRIIVPTLRGIREEGFDYRYFLYIGIMMTPDGPVALEYNVRPGNPEFLALWPMLLTCGLDVVDSTVGQSLGSCRLEWDPDNTHSVAVTSTTAGYPFTDHVVRVPVHGLSQVEPNVELAIDGIESVEGELITSGSRVVTVIGKSTSFSGAREQAYRNLSKIKYHGAYYRRDIGEFVAH